MWFFYSDVPVVLSPPLSKERVYVVPSKLGDTISVNITVFSNDGGIEVSVERNDDSVNPKPIRAVVSETKVMLPVFGKLIEEDGYSIHVILFTENANDMSDYTVRIKNDFKQTMLLIDVKPEGPPTIPTQFALNNVDQNAIEASWLAEFNGGFRQTFVIQISIDEIHWSNASIRTEDTDRSNDIYRLTISNLDHSTTYFLRLYAFNELGLSGFTSVLQATTSDTQDHASKGALIGGIVGGCTSMIIAVLVASLLLWRRRRAIPKEVENPMCVEAESTITQTPSFAHATSRGETRTERTTIDDLYAVVDKNAKTSGIYTNCSGEPNDKRQGSTKLINHAGLVYADVVFDKPALEQEQFTIHGLEDRTEYAQVDLAI
ncbi:hypothetical protein MAR_021068 [Mya arenaria]|uniref:Fibronectin type-III domain-containing protein n=1 Tax=Mya arenaria TaxID=6604 RepID=A0ABY7E941_MYAAR|nr:hypothetical protein MAR_021068 [Mya arenaria]